MLKKSINTGYVGSGTSISSVNSGWVTSASKLTNSQSFYGTTQFYGTTLTGYVAEIIKIHPTRVNEAITGDASALSDLVYRIAMVCPGVMQSDIVRELERHLNYIQAQIVYQDKGWK